jgi:hypothetical protein
MSMIIDDFYQYAVLLEAQRGRSPLAWFRGETEPPHPQRKQATEWLLAQAYLVLVYDPTMPPFQLTAAGRARFEELVAAFRALSTGDEAQ